MFFFLTDTYSWMIKCVATCYDRCECSVFPADGLLIPLEDPELASE